MQRCAHCGHYGRRNTHCSPRKRKLRYKTPRPRQRANKNDKKRGILPTECFIPAGTPRYSHRPFDDMRCIRLLVLLPGNKWDPVRCELVVRSLDNAQFEAISYAWGLEEDRGDIFCHNQRLRIPWSLEHGLRKFRRLRKKRVLWADSICINQDDKAERGHQVQNMSRIYEVAKRVLVWLGHSSCSHHPKRWHYYSNPSALFEFIRALGPLPPPDHQSADYVNFQIKACGWKHWQTFINIGKAAWFHRLWVIQEICLASCAIVHDGPASLDWKALASFCIYMLGNLYNLAMDSQLELMPRIYSFLSLKFRDAGRSIPFVLWSGSHMSCLDPRDRVYAFLGHKACLDTISNPHSELFLPVDYSISYKDLYTAIAVRILQAGNYSSLDVIDFVRHNSISVYDHEIGSWVPRWDLVGSKPFVFRPAESKYAAHGQTMVEASLDGNCLSVAGFTFDSVVWVSETFRRQEEIFPIEPSNALDHPTPHPFLQAWNHIRNTQNTGSRNMLTAMCSITTGDLMGTKEERRSVNGAVAYAWLMGLDVSGLEDLIAFEEIPRFRRMANIRFLRYFITSRGWIGIGPEATLPGDDVCIFLGALTPFVSRQLPSAGEALYRLCGPCLVHGIMRGEAIKMWEGGAFDKTTFNLV